MFPLKFGEHNNRVTNMAYEDTSWLWHLKYGYFFFLGYKKVLALQALISGLPKVEKHKNIFEECAKGKHTRENFSKDNAWRAHRPLQFVHLDIFGPMQTKSLGKLSYFIIFIDDYSQKW